MNTYTGQTTINAGTISIAADSALGTPPVTPTPDQLTFNGGTLLVTADLGFSPNRGITLTGAGTLNINPGVTATYAGVIGGSGTLTKSGTGTLVLSGENVNTGQTTITAGTLSVAADSAFGAVPGSPTPGLLTFNGGTLLVTADFTLNANRGVALTGAATFNISPGVTLTYNGIIAGLSSLTKSTGTGTLVLAGPNTYGGATTISTGVLRVGDSSALGTTVGGTTIASGAALEIDGSGLVIAENITSLQGTGISATGGIRNLANDNTLSGAITLANATRINSDAGTLTLSGSVSGPARPLTVGGGGNTVISGPISTTTGTVTKDGTGVLSLSASNSYSGATTINGGTVSIGADDGLGAPPASPVAGKLTLAGGTLLTAASFALDSNRGIAINGAGGTFDVATGVTLTYAGIATGSGGLTKVGLGAIDLSGATVTAGALTIAAGTIVAPTANAFNIAGDWTNDASNGALTAGSGTVTLNGGSGQAVGGSFATTFNSLRISDAAGVTLTNDAYVGGVLTLTSGKVVTGAYVLALTGGSSVSRTSGHVVGYLRKAISTGDSITTFEVGDATSYTPVAVSFSGVTSTGDLTVSTTAGDHPNIGGSSLDPAQTVNRYWTLSNAGVDFGSYGATFNFVSGDVDAGVDPNDFVAQRYSGGGWIAAAVGGRGATTIQATGLTGFGDFALGVPTDTALDHFVVSTPTSATAGQPINVTVSAVDSVGNTVTGYAGTITFSSTDVYGAFSPATYVFLPGDHGSKTFNGAATLKAAGDHTISVTGTGKSGISPPITVGPGAFARLLLVVPGESPEFGSPSGKTGVPAGQLANNAFLITVYAVDAYWNALAATDTVAITSSDANAGLPPDAALVGGSVSFSVTPQAGGPTTFSATDVTDGSKSAATSSSISIMNSAPTANADSYTTAQDGLLIVSAAGVLGNDVDAEGQPVLVADPRPASGPVHGSLTLNADGSFRYTPLAGYSGSDSFTYFATDGYLTSASATVTITIRDPSLVSASGWPTSFAADRFLQFTFPAYVPNGAVVSGATFRHSYRSLDGAGTTCFYFEVYEGANLIGAHGSTNSPISCNATAGYVFDAIDLPEVDSVARANAVTIKVYYRNSVGAQSQTYLATLGTNYGMGN